MSTESSDRVRERWFQLGLVAGAVLLSLSAWLTATAVAPELRARWALTTPQVGWLTTVVQVGFVAGTASAAFMNLADVLSSRAYFALSALLAATANAVLLVASDYPVALAARFFTGFFLAGVYPPGMKMMATWFRAERGLAIGTIVGALTVGKAMPYLMKAFGGPDAGFVIAGASWAGLLSAAMVGLAYRDGPHDFPRRAFEWRRVGRILRHRPTMLATGGYLGHMWELYAMWSLIGLFFTDYFGLRGSARADLHAPLATFSVIAIGGVGAVLAGRWADRVGRARVTIGSMAVSGGCALTAGWLLAAPPWLVLGVTLVWGFTIVADSAQFSAVVTERAPPDSVGTALMLQTMAGFALTGVSIQLTSTLATAWGWGPAFAILALGPVCGIKAMRALQPDDVPVV
ncbi:MAG: MFS transporter [Gemmatimonadota bacterium]|nr:MFS transporter [Gemmatimonadota bacterium]